MNYTITPTARREHHRVLSRFLQISYALRMRMYVRQVKFGARVLTSVGDHTRKNRLQLLIASCSEGTIGKAVYQFMQEHGFDFVPHREGHDFKHVLLGFKSEPFDEMRMEAFVYGNTGLSLISVAIFCSFLIYVPEIWRELPHYYIAGKKVKPITAIPLEELALCDLQDFRSSTGITAFLARREKI